MATTSTDHKTRRSSGSGSRQPAGVRDDHAARSPQLVTRLGFLEVDWPRSVGFFGGIGLAVGAGLIEPPLGLFIAAVPLLKMLDLPALPNRLRVVSQVFEGVAKPVGGDSEGTVRIVTGKGASDQPVESD